MTFFIKTKNGNKLNMFFLRLDACLVDIFNMNTHTKCVIARRLVMTSHITQHLVVGRALSFPFPRTPYSSCLILHI